MKKVRVLVAKIGLDGHDRGAKVISYALRDAGMEVIYTGIRQKPENIVSMAIQEDVDVIGVSSLTGAHKKLLPEMKRLLLEAGADDILVIVGGIIPKKDIEELKKQGINAVFGPGSPIKDIVQFINQNVKRPPQGNCGG